MMLAIRQGASISKSAYSSRSISRTFLSSKRTTTSAVSLARAFYVSRSWLRRCWPTSQESHVTFAHAMCCDPRQSLAGSGLGFPKQNLPTCQLVDVLIFTVVHSLCQLLLDASMLHTRNPSILVNSEIHVSNARPTLKRPVKQAMPFVKTSLHAISQVALMQAQPQTTGVDRARKHGLVALGRLSRRAGGAPFCPLHLVDNP